MIGAEVLENNLEAGLSLLYSVAAFDEAGLLPRTHNALPFISIIPKH